MSISFEINSEAIEWAREVVSEKKSHWERLHPTLKFDVDGRAVVGELPTFNEEEFTNKIKSQISKGFERCIKEAFREMRLEEISLSDISYKEFLSKRITVKTLTGFTQERALPSILSKANAIWEKQEMPMYRNLRNVYKGMVKEKVSQVEVNKVKNIINNMEKGNVYISYDNLMRIFQPKQIIMSINPLDKLFAAGGEGTNSLTKFSSCWRNSMEVTNEGTVIMTSDGEYSNPEAQVVLGMHPSCGILIIPNDNTIKVEDTTFYGMLQRSHTWLCKDGIFLENIYPDKESNELRRKITNALRENNLSIAEPSPREEIVVPEGFNSKSWYKDYRLSCYDGHVPYLDRGQIDSKDGKIVVGF